MGVAWSYCSVRIERYTICNWFVFVGYNGCCRNRAFKIFECATIAIIFHITRGVGLQVPSSLFTLPGGRNPARAKRLTGFRLLRVRKFKRATLEISSITSKGVEVQAQLSCVVDVAWSFILYNVRAGVRPHSTSSSFTSTGNSKRKTSSLITFPLGSNPAFPSRRGMTTTLL
jgi:hypothetical protein